MSNSKALTWYELSHLSDISGSDPQLDALDAALARLDFLERKVQAADGLSTVVREWFADKDNTILFHARAAYDEVTE